MKKKIKLFPVFILLSILITTISIITFFYNDSKKWKIKITHNAGVNVRIEPNPFAKHYGKAMQNSKYKVIDTFNDDSKFIWYKIKLTRKLDAWVASDRENPYVEEFNNPLAKKLNKNYIDYDKPEVRFLENPYNEESINNINYDHIDIKDKSDFKVSHNVYKEVKGVDVTYWLEIIVVDEFGNKKEVTQEIIFITNPSDNEVKDFHILKDKRTNN